jgi:hypothetical protein
MTITILKSEKKVSGNGIYHVRFKAISTQIFRAKFASNFRIFLKGCLMTQKTEGAQRCQMRHGAHRERQLETNEGETSGGMFKFLFSISETCLKPLQQYFAYSVPCVVARREALSSRLEQGMDV